MMKSDVLVLRNEDAVKDMGLDFEPFDKMGSGTMFDDIGDEQTTKP